MKTSWIAGALATSFLFVGLGVSPASGAISPPEAAATVWNCEGSNPGFTVTGLVGDTFTIQNTSILGACNLLQMDGIVTASDNVGAVTQIAANTTVTFTIVGDGLFLVEQGGGGLTGVTVVVAQPDPDPEPAPDPGSTEAEDSLPNTGASSSASVALTALAGLALVSLGVIAVIRRRASKI